MESELIKTKKALDNCIGCKPCKDCPYELGYLNFPSCAVSMMKDALKLIRDLENKGTKKEGNNMHEE